MSIRKEVAVTTPAAVNLRAWIDEHRHLLKPPVGNACIWNSNFLVMVVGGPNQRSDFHINPGEELFYQIEGNIVVRIMEGGSPRDIPVKEGELFLLPAGIPHSPQRPANTVGLVVEQPKAFKDAHHLRWHCRECHTLLHDFQFIPDDLGKQIKEMIESFKSRLDWRTCKKCHRVFDI